MDTNERWLLEFLAAIDLDIFNRGKEPIFCIAVKREVLDLTICSRQLVQAVISWSFLKEPFVSDHRQIIFGLNNVKIEKVRVRDSKKNDWDLYGEDLSVSLKDPPKRYGTPQEIELCKDSFWKELFGKDSQEHQRHSLVEPEAVKSQDGRMWRQEQGQEQKPPVWLASAS